MDKFIAKLNGVEYTDRQKFIDAFNATKPEDIKSVSVQESSENEKPKTVETTRKKDPNNLFMGNPSFFAAISEAVNKFAKILNEFSDAQEEIPETTSPEPEAPEAPEAPDEPEYTKEELVEKFSFKHTTYQFKGNEEDDNELDKFDGLLVSKLEEFENMPFNHFNEDDLMFIRQSFEKRYDVMKECENNTTKKLKNIDIIIAKYEEFIKLHDDLGFDVDEKIKNALKESELHFEIEANRQNYYELLVNYYGALIGIIDKQF
jgi:hypothetical protein